MIKINKTVDTIPVSLTSVGIKEFAEAKKQLKETGVVKVDFKAYRMEDVKDKLIEVFKKKCAYCESTFLVNSPGAVEHFRPKGKAKHSKGFSEKYQGYYWLAAKWENLLLSCTDCNSVRRHFATGEKGKISMGKQDQFPLADEKLRCYRHSQDISREKAVMFLVNPCDDKEDPELFFEFTTEGIIKIHSALQTDFEKTKSQKSIDIYALRRQELVDARKEHYLKEIGAKILDIEKLKETLTLLPENAMAAIQNINSQINSKLRELIKLGNPENRYSAMSKQLVKQEVLNRLGINVSTIQ